MRKKRYSIVEDKEENIMDHAIENLFNGAIYPAEKVLPRDSEYIEAIRRQCKLADQLEKRLKAEDYKLVEEMCDCEAAVQDKQAFEFFRRGLSLGLCLMWEAKECLDTSAG
ncbi:MAG: hypothetical protein LUG93_10195 [Lachnospiraceae bacterium]|nr:hypothetical protein [Lachnospiraceae bacterium]